MIEGLQILAKYEDRGLDTRLGGADHDIFWATTAGDYSVDDDECKHSLMSDSFHIAKRALEAVWPEPLFTEDERKALLLHSEISSLGQPSAAPIKSARAKLNRTS
jgi:hypothetical protein